MQQDQAKAAPLQMAEGEVLYMQQFHLGQVYSENSSQLAVLRTNRICPGIYPNAPPAGHPERRGAHLELEHGGAVGRQEELPDGRGQVQVGRQAPAGYRRPAHRLDRSRHGTPDLRGPAGCRILLDKDGELYAVGQGGELDYEELLNWAIAEYVEQHSSTKEEYQVCSIAAVLGRSKGIAAEAGASSTACWPA